MVVIAVELLLVTLGSLEVELTVAMLVEVLALLKVLAVALMVTMTRLPTGMLPMLQFTVVPLTEQLPWVAETEEYVTCAGSGSLTVTPCATAGPLFVT